MPVQRSTPPLGMNAPPVYRPAQSQVSLQARRNNAAPPVYRPAQGPLQAKLARGSVVLASSPARSGVGAPPVYRPAQAAVSQRAMAPRASAAPPVYRPGQPSLALQAKPAGAAPPVYRPSTSSAAPVQKRTARPPASAWGGAIQRVTNVGDDLKEGGNLVWGKMWKSDAKPSTERNIPVIIEVMENDRGSAIQKIMSMAEGTKLHRTTPVAFVVGINAQNSDIGKTDKKSLHGVAGQLRSMDETCKQIAQCLEDNGMLGGCFPFLWKKTGEGGYTFPFLEARSLLTLHGGSISVQQDMRGFGNPVVRSMDADVTDDPLFTGNRVPGKKLEEISYSMLTLFSGGYSWRAGDITREYLDNLHLISSHDKSDQKELLAFLKAAVDHINEHEHAVRKSLSEINALLVYWPEPNSYMSLDLRKIGAESARDGVSPGVQQRESSHYVRNLKDGTASYDRRYTVSKPIKTYLDDQIRLLTKLFRREQPAQPATLKRELEAIRQSHLDIEKVINNVKYHNAKNVDDLASKARDIVQYHLEHCAQEIIALLPPSTAH
jgi:hypothetical protein